MSAHLDLLMFAAACLVLLMGFPVAFTLAGVALAFGLIGQSLDIFDMGFFYALPQRIFGTMTNEVLIAVPLFVFMGTMLERARVAEDLLENMSRLFAGVRGGLGISVSIVGALLAASTGIVGATVVTMSLLSLPTMLRRGYAPSLAAGSIAAAGTLGQIIPPSIVLVLLGDVIANAYQKAQLEQGIFAPETVSVGELFSGSLIPGLVLVGLYIIYQVGLAIFKPSMAPPAEYDDDLVLSDLLGALFAPVFLIISVLGSILAGIATPPRRRPLVPWEQFCWPDTSSATDKNSWPRRPFRHSCRGACQHIRPAAGARQYRRDGPFGDRRRFGFVRCHYIGCGHKLADDLSAWRFGIDHAQHHTHNLHGLCHSHWRGAVLAGVSRPGRRRHHSRSVAITPRWHMDCRGRGDAGYVFARIFPRLHRDYICGRAACRASAAGHGRRSGLAGRHDGD